MTCRLWLVCVRTRLCVCVCVWLLRLSGSKASFFLFIFFSNGDRKAVKTAGLCKCVCVCACVCEIMYVWQLDAGMQRTVADNPCQFGLRQPPNTPFSVNVCVHVGVHVIVRLFECVCVPPQPGSPSAIHNSSTWMRTWLQPSIHPTHTRWVCLTCFSLNWPAVRSRLPNPIMSREMGGKKEITESREEIGCYFHHSSRTSQSS